MMKLLCHSCRQNVRSKEDESVSVSFMKQYMCYTKVYANYDDPIMLMITYIMDNDDIYIYGTNTSSTDN